MRDTTEAIYKEGRRMGNTTRKIDKAIEILMEDDKVLIKVSEQEIGCGRRHSITLDLLDMVLRRLKSEWKYEELIVDRTNFIIELAKPNYRGITI